MLKSWLFASVLAMSASGSFDLGEPFQLQVGEMRRQVGGDLGLRFTEVSRDSRCPKDARCIVAGEADVVVEAELGAERRTLEFRVPPAGSDVQELDSFTVRITALEPQTESTRRIDPGEYIATIVVTAATLE